MFTEQQMAMKSGDHLMFLTVFFTFGNSARTFSSTLNNRSQNACTSQESVLYLMDPSSMYAKNVVLQSKGTVFEVWVYNPRPSSLCFAATGNRCKSDELQNISQ
jgi:hypothetical protein